jgi:hypothetical protein
LKLADLAPRVVRPLGGDSGPERSVELPKINQEDPAMPRGVYERKPKDSSAAPKKRTPRVAAPPLAKRARGQYSDVLAELRAKRAQIDAAIEAIEALE